MQPEPRASFRWISRADAWANRVYGSRWNPLYHSGALTIGMLAVLLVTGLYLLLFYRIGAPYESVALLHAQPLAAGRWVRGVHRFASDAAVICAGVHAFRMYTQQRTWGPRALAWISGVVLLAVIFVSGWTGYVLVWDSHAQLLATEGARILDALPIFSEPIGRSFVGETAVPSAFFFLTLFAHIALPIGVGGLVWLHVARVARPVLLPARPVLWGALAALAVLAVAWPPVLAPAADLLGTPRDVPLDWFFGFWLPVTQRLPAWSAWATGAVIVGLSIAIPKLTKPSLQALPSPATVNERVCTGCEQCVRDCPYDAIVMVARSDGREGEVARVNDALCTSCGVCIGSCPPMAIGPLRVTARDQIADVRAFLDEHSPGDCDVVIVGCAWSAARAQADHTGAKFMAVPCVGAIHSSTVELLLRGGAGGVLVVGCAEHDGRTREGVTWTRERLFEARPAELKDRVDRDRVRLVQAALGESARLHAAATAFATDIGALVEVPRESFDVILACARQRAATEDV